MITLEDKKTSDVYDKIHQVSMEYIQVWKEETLFHWEWWVSSVLCIAPWILWTIYRKKESTQLLLFVGFFMIIITSWLDFIGVSLGLWHYTGSPIPTIPSYIPWDFSLFPVTVMLLIQYKPEASPYIKALLFGGGTSFIGEPVFHVLGMYHLDNWQYYYSFPLYFVIYLLAHFLSGRKRFEEIQGTAV